jgi:hypothetical protein
MAFSLSRELAAKTPVVEADADAEAIFWEVRIDDSSRRICPCGTTFE